MTKRTFQEIIENLEEVVSRGTPLGRDLWSQLLKVHPADIALFLTDTSDEVFDQIMHALPQPDRLEIFEYLSDTKKVQALSLLTKEDQMEALTTLSTDDLTELFDSLSDDELKQYLELLNKEPRERVIALLKFSPDSAARMMDSDVISLVDDFTVEKSVKLIQRLQPSRDIYQHIYVTDRHNTLIGHIALEDLLFHKPQDRIASFMQENKLVVQVNEDQDEVSKEMIHYDVTIAPVVSKNNHFLGVITSSALVDAIVEEAGDDVQRMAAMTPLKESYFETSFWRLLYARGHILVILLLAESFSTTILESYNSLLGVLYIFIPMLISAGGNTSSQTSAMVIQGIASGDLRRSNMARFFKREFLMAAGLGGILGVAAFARSYYTIGNVALSLGVAFALTIIVVASVVLGSTVPFVLRRLNIDPAFSAGPFLATAMDVIGIFIFVFITQFIAR